MNQEYEQDSATLPHSEACERNKGPILEQLEAAFARSRRVLEIGSGTGQHAVHFAAALAHLRWLPADTGEYLPGLRARVAREGPANLDAVIELDVRMQPWPVPGVDAIFSANTLHFMSVDCAAEFFRGVGEVLEPTGRLAVYGPFRYGGEFTSPSNAQFDVWLKQTDPVRGVKDFEWINELARQQSLELLSDTPMPANNQLLLWQRG